MTTIYAFPTPDGTFLAAVAALPGCIARGATRDAAVAGVRRTFRDYVEMLARFGISTEAYAGLDPETFSVTNLEPGTTFPEDLRSADAAELAAFLKRMEASRSALLALVRPLTQEQLERKPSEEQRSIREILEHVMVTETALLSRLEPWPGGGFATLQAVHRMAFQRFSVMEPEDTGGEHRIQGGRWTVRRVMRRILEHEYEHVLEIRERLTSQGN